MTEVSVLTPRARTHTFASDKHPPSEQRPTLKFHYPDVQYSTLLSVPRLPIKGAAVQRFSGRPTLLFSRLALDDTAGRLQLTRLPEQPLVERHPSPITQSNQPPKDLS